MSWDKAGFADKIGNVMEADAKQFLDELTTAIAQAKGEQA